MNRLAKETGIDVKQTLGAMSAQVPSQSQQETTPDSTIQAASGVELNAKPEKSISDGSSGNRVADSSRSASVQSEINPEDFIQNQLDVLEEWIGRNSKMARRDSIRYWIFKIPAIICTVSVTAFEVFGYGQVNVVLGVVAAFCVAVDAAFPGGQLHNAHKRAANEARRLQHNAIGKWQKAQLDTNVSLEEAARTIIDYIQRERTRIDKYVTDAEASLGNQNSLH